MEDWKVSWIMANVVEQVMNIRKTSEASFVHVKRSANSYVDQVAKAGVSHQNLVIINEESIPPLV